VVAEDGGGREVNANANRVGPWETFRIEKIGGTGVIRDRDAIALRTSDGQYVVAENGGGGGHIYKVKATHYNIAGYADIFLLKLARLVPESIAKPMPVLRGLPGDALRDPTRFWRDQRFEMVGFGNPSRFRQIADAERGEFPCNTSFGPVSGP
jgi:hypothetical protein